MKIVINTCYGGFSLSKEALAQYEQATGKSEVYDHDIPRNDPELVRIVETGQASGQFAALKVVEIPDDVEWQIEEYDGTEWVAEKHRTWS